MDCSKATCIGLFLILLLNSCNDVSSQETSYELPVQLIGFPAIIASVRFTNFLKKLNYALSPATYRARSRRELNIDGPPFYNAKEVQEYIVNEYGADACIFERPCVHYAVRAATKPNAPLNWSQIFDQYSQAPEESKEYYLLSVFLGNVVASPKLCLQLGKLRGCPDVY